jgi:hypothetical protein
MTDNLRVSARTADLASIAPGSSSAVVAQPDGTLKAVESTCSPARGTGEAIARWRPSSLAYDDECDGDEWHHESSAAQHMTKRRSRRRAGVGAV